MNPARLDAIRGSALRQLLLLLAIAGVLFLCRLGSAPLWDDDETRFASVAREMLESGDWVVPRFQGELADKPPLLFWMIAAGFRVFGEGDAAARLAAAVFSLIAVAVTWETARRLYGPRIAWWSGLALTTSLLFAAEARLATTDAMLLALVAAAMLIGVTQWWREGARFRNRRFGFAAAFGIGAVCGLGILAKGPAALLLPVLVLWLFAWWMSPPGDFPPDPVTIFRSAWKSMLSLRPVAILGGAALVAAPWHVLAWWETGGEWFRLFYLQHHAGRLPWLEPLTGEAMQPVQGQRGFPFFQVMSLLGGLFPWSVFLPLAVWRTFREAMANGWRARPAPAAGLLLLWLIVWLVVVSFSSTQLPHYSFPAYPAAAIMVAVLLVRGVRDPAGLARGWLYTAAVGLVFGGGVIAALPIIATASGILPWLPALMLLGGIPLAMAVSFAILVHVGKRQVAAVVFGCGSALLCAAVFWVAAPAVGALNPMPEWIRIGDAATGGRARIAAWKIGMPLVVWHAGRPVLVCNSADEVAGFLQTGPDACAFVDASAYAPVCKALGLDAAIVAHGQPLLRKGEVLLIIAPRVSTTGD